MLRRVEQPVAACTEKARAHHLRHRGGKVLLGPGLLGQIADGSAPERPAPLNAARQGGQQAQQAFEQRGLAGAVFTHDADVVPPAHLKIQMLPNGLALIAQAGIPAGQ